MKHPVFCMVLAALATAAAAQSETLTLRDLDGKNPRRLGKDEVTQLLTGARMSRIAATGSRHAWTNDPDGSFVISSDNMGAGASPRFAGRPSTANGKWHISDDGRYCVLIDWRAVATEEWCRFILQTSDGYYATRADSVGTERVHRLEIAR